MDTINKIELKDASTYPDEHVLQDVLGDSYAAYCDLIKLFDANEMTHEWRYYHDGKAWLCKVQKKKKTIVWMSAWRGFMNATVYVHEKDMDGVYNLELGEEHKERFRASRKMGKSTACSFEIRGSEVLEDFAKVMQYKIATK
jgi:hypothetical protein